MGDNLTLLEQHAVQLSEHFDSVRIVVTQRTDKGETAMLTCGRGNWYAQKASVEEWLTEQDQETREQVRSRIKNEVDDE